jgi:glutamate dehydrogenase/leucine dehydrogenase
MVMASGALVLGLYAPDYVINAGGLINIAQELEPGGYDRQRALQRVATIERTLSAIFDRARCEDLPPSQVADRMARERIDAARSTPPRRSQPPVRTPALSPVPAPAVVG